MNLNALPSVDEVLRHKGIKGLKGSLPDHILTNTVRACLESLRQDLMNNKGSRPDRHRLLAQAVRKTRLLASTILDPRLKRVINGTGIILHTGLGRAPLAPAAVKNVTRVIRHYANIEHDLETGKRGRRESIVEGLVRQLTGAEAATVVNNNAAAVLLVLNTFAFKKDSIISRGELVEIGGSFRVPDIMRKSGTRMVEVGTTNRTFIQDYEKAVGPRTGLLVKVHTSNYRVKGFTNEVALKDLVRLGKKTKLPVFYDMGGGVLCDLRKLGLPQEPRVADCLEQGIDIICFSGDKMLGGPQCGIIAGKREYLDRVRKNPLMRTVRCGKMTYAALEPTLRLFLNEENLAKTHPVIGMLAQSVKELEEKCVRLLKGIEKPKKRFCEKAECFSQTGGGALPLEAIKSVAVRIRAKGQPTQELLQALARQEPPVVGYIKDGYCYLDLRTIREDETPMVAKAINLSIQ